MDTAILPRGLPQGPTPPLNQTKQGKLGPDHRRAYQACDQCRARKVKCDLGNVDAPREPPCARCKRESKSCTFQKQRKKDGSSSREPEHGIHLGRDPAFLTASNSYDDGVNGGGSVNYNDSPRYNGGSASPQPWQNPLEPGRPPTHDITSYPSQTVARPMAAPSYSARVVASAAAQFGSGGDHYRNEAVADLLSPTITNPNDALRVLSDAAGQINNQNMSNQAQHSPSTTFSTPNSSGSHYHRGDSFSNKKKSNSATGDGALSPGRVDPRLANAGGTAEDPIYIRGLQLWSNFKFVRNGWFSSREAMEYIDYYYNHLAPMTPIELPNFRSPKDHFTLLTEEPMLAVTMLTLASRHMPLSGQGAQSRAFSIHSNLWSYLRGMIERLFWGQELFGGNGTFGGFGGAPVDALKPHDPAVSAPKLNWTGSLRSFGTIEALLLLTDWHPRALHFSPGHDESLLDNMRSTLDQQMNGIHDRRDSSGNVQQGRAAFATWLEPAWRSDRMCWMLLGNAMALGFELGLFDKKHRSDPSPAKEQYAVDPADCPRARRLRRLLLIYITQNSGRLGITSPLPLREWKDSQNDITPRVPNGPNKRRKVDEAGSQTDAMQGCWMDIANIMSDSNEQIFPSKEYTAQLINNGKYHEMIKKFMPILGNWRTRFDRTPLPDHMRCVLTIEYEYTRLYINSLGLQAVVEGWKHLFKVAADQPDGAAPSAGKSGPPGAKLVEVYRDNENYVTEVADASRSVLRTMIEGFYRDESLRNAPVRIYFRTLSAAMFLLKTFAFGAREDEVTSSMQLLKETSKALRECVVDDVHLSITIASLLDSLTNSISSRFVRFAVPNNHTTNETDSHNDAAIPSREASEQQLPAFQDQEPRPIVPSAFENGAFMPPVDPAYNAYMQGNAMISHAPTSGISGDMSAGMTAFDDADIPPDYYALPLEGFADTFGQGTTFGNDIGPPGSSVDDWFQAIINSGTGTAFDPNPGQNNAGGQHYYNTFNTM